MRSLSFCKIEKFREISVIFLVGKAEISLWEFSWEFPNLDLKDQLAASRRSLRLARAAKECAGAEAALAEMIAAHPWIATERHLFGAAGGEFQ